MRTMPKAPTTMDVLTVLSVYFICAYTLLVFFQIKTNLTYNKCKAATDFMFGEITAILFPKEIELIHLLDKEHLSFDEKEHFTDWLKDNNIDKEKKLRVKMIVKEILNFYERMAISIFKGILDEDMCYDDKGRLMMDFYKWSAPYVRELQASVDSRAWANVDALNARWKQRYQSHSIKIQKWYYKRVYENAILGRDVS